MAVYTVAATDEFEMVWRTSFESLSEAFECLDEWLEAHESGSTPLYALELSDESDWLEKYDFLAE